MAVSTALKIFTISTHILNVIAATAAGCYSVYLFYLLLFIKKEFSPTYLQSYVALIYVVILSVFLTAVELRTLRHAHLITIAFFLMGPIGRGFTLIFMGAILLGALVWGWVVGICVIVVGVINIIVGITSRKRTAATELA